MNIEEVIKTVLKIINYTDDPTIFYKKFADSCQKTAFAQLISSLSTAQKDSFIDQLQYIFQQIFPNKSSSQNLSHDELIDLLVITSDKIDSQAYQKLQLMLSQFGYNKLLEASISKGLHEMTAEVLPTLSTDRQEELKRYLSSL